ncbi:hypothetical protein PITCH_A840020 [uncultured Desulfobacterium sp.]|uniref:Uncharacterized protein n=1 Tax=uncultured Desulfobacterium sp. TaxID=201089 RepID=A0A445N363_9BACT|nr:hypothetical protein PITCH_A840020 [uncultured Desulfobacterium sp.]
MIRTQKNIYLTADKDFLRGHLITLNPDSSAWQYGHYVLKDYLPLVMFQ